MNELEIFKLYCKFRKREGKFAFLRSNPDGTRYLELLNNTTSNFIAYKGLTYNLDKIYSLSEGTCGGVCEIGKPKEGCPYNKNKCAVYYLIEINPSTYQYYMNFSDLKEFINLIEENDSLNSFKLDEKEKIRIYK